jgi:biopolymer transport protein ExbB/TolQ
MIVTWAVLVYCISQWSQVAGAIVAFLSIPWVTGRVEEGIDKALDSLAARVVAKQDGSDFALAMRVARAMDHQSNMRDLFELYFTIPEKYRVQISDKHEELIYEIESSLEIYCSAMETIKSGTEKEAAREVEAILDSKEGLLQKLSA